METYDVVILGATFLSLGVAKVQNGNTLIIDSKGKPGYEFIDAYHNGDNYAFTPQTPEGKAFRSFMEEQGLCQNVFIPEWTAYVSDWICKNNLSVLLFTTVLSVENHGDSKKITIFNSNGKQVIYARKVIDTVTHDYTKKTLNLVSYGECPEAFTPAMEVTPHDELFSLVSFDIPLSYCMAQAKQVLYTAWENRPESCKNTTIAALSDTFYLKAANGFRQTAENQYEAPSTFYDNPFMAFDKGAAIGGAL